MVPMMLEQHIKQVHNKRNPHINNDTLFDETHCLSITAQLLRAVQHLQNNGIVHRDLKLDNVLLDAQASSVRVMDLGEALDCRANPLIDGFRQQYIDGSQSRGGASYYYAPEIARKPDYGDWLNYEKNDIWAVGIIMYKILAGKDKDPYATGMGTGQPESWNPLDKRYHKKTRELCRNLLQINFDERVSCSEALQQLSLIPKHQDEQRLEEQGGAPAAH